MAKNKKIKTFPEKYRERQDALKQEFLVLLDNAGRTNLLDADFNTIQEIYKLYILTGNYSPMPDSNAYKGISRICYYAKNPEARKILEDMVEIIDKNTDLLNISRSLKDYSDNNLEFPENWEENCKKKK